MPDDHSEVVPLLPIPNRTVKRLCADDSADSRVKVGHRQAIKPENALSDERAFFFVWLFSLPLVAVGTEVTPRPPHRSVRAELPHTAPASGM